MHILEQITQIGHLTATTKQPYGACIDMNKKILVPILVVAAIIPLLGLSMLPPDADTIGKEFAKNNPGVTIGISSVEADLSELDEINTAQLIIEGIIQDVRPFWKIDRGDEYPYIQTEYVVKVNHVVKGDVQVDQTISVLMSGGTLDGVTAYTEGVTMQKGDNVIMLLGKDINSIWGDSYHPVSVTKSTYLLDGNLAKNYRVKEHG